MPFIADANALYNIDRIIKVRGDGDHRCHIYYENGDTYVDYSLAIVAAAITVALTAVSLDGNDPSGYIVHLQDVQDTALAVQAREEAENPTVEPEETGAQVFDLVHWRCVMHYDDTFVALELPDDFDPASRRLFCQSCERTTRVRPYFDPTEDSEITIEEAQGYVNGYLSVPSSPTRSIGPIGTRDVWS